MYTRVVRTRTNNSQSPFGAFATGRSHRPLNLATRPTLSGAFHRAPLLWDTVRPDPSFRAYPDRESHAFGRLLSLSLSLSLSFSYFCTCNQQKRTKERKIRVKQRKRKKEGGDLNEKKEEKTSFCVNRSVVGSAWPLGLGTSRGRSWM